MSVYDEIDNYFTSDVKKGLARKCFEKGKEWQRLAIIQKSLMGDQKYKAQLRKECYAYIKENVDTSDEKKVYGSIILMFILGAIISWVVQKILDRIFEKE